MKTKSTLIMLALFGAMALTASAQDNLPPADNPPPNGQTPAQPAGSRAQPGFHLLPPPLAQQMNLTEDQKAQIIALESDTKTKLAKILTANQMKQLNSFHPPRGGMRGGQGRGGSGPDGGDNFMPPPSGGDGNGGPAGPPPGDN
jgi:Spy/CpxP family protein refolding chaperone